MGNQLLIGDVTSLAAFEPAIRLQAISADLDNPYFRDYILTEDLANVYERILSSVLGDQWGATTSTLPAERLRSHLISAQYGTGKSYFLTVLSALLAAGGNPLRLQTAKEKFAAFPPVQKLLGSLADKRFLIVRISAEDKGDTSFRELLVHSLLEEVSKILPDATFANEYTEAINHLQSVDSLPIGPALIRVLDEEFGSSPQQVLAQLGAYDRDGLRTYYRAYERASGRKVSRDILDVNSTFQEALSLLRPRGYTHIAVLVDEMTAYLLASVGHQRLAETLGQLQSFAAHCNKAASHCLFVGAMHVSVQEFLKERSQQRDYDKMKGRCEEHPFPIYSTKLLAGVFRPKQSAFEQAMKGHLGQRRQLERLIDTFKMTDDDKPIKLSAFYPLHPAVAHYLPRMARELGQAERTSFGFIDEVVRPKLREPFAAEELNLVTLDEAFDYFLPAMEQRPYYLQVITAWNVVQNKASNPLARRAFKTLVSLWVASRARLTTGEPHYLDIDLSSEEIRDYINTDDDAALSEALEALREVGYVYYNPATKRYFYSHADPGWDLEGEVEKQMANIDPNEVLHRELKGLGYRVCLNAPESVCVKVDRTVESQRMDIEQLKQAVAVRPRKADGKIVFVVPDFAEVETYDSLLNDVRLKARDLASFNAVVAVPKSVEMLDAKDLRRYSALQRIGEQLAAVSEGSVSEHRLMLLRAAFAEAQSRVGAAVEAFGHASNFVFYIDHQPHDAPDVDAALVRMLTRYYDKFPNVRVERINGRSTTNALIESCIVNLETTFPSDSSEVARQARDTLQVLGLCSWRQTVAGVKVELKEPTPDCEAYPIWKLALEVLTGSSKAPFSDLYKRLGRAPYGLPDYMVELYIAAARALKKIYILDRNGTMPTLGKHLVQAITRRMDSEFRIIVVKESAIPYTYICSVWRAIDAPLRLRHFRDLEQQLGRAIDDTKMWFAFKADSNNLLVNRLSRVAEHLKTIGAESRIFSTLTKHLEAVRRIVSPFEGYERLAALGKELSGVEVLRDPDTAALAVQRAIEVADEFVTEWPALSAAFSQHRRLLQLDVLDRFGEDAKAVQAAWESCKTEALSADARSTYIAQFGKLWESYAEQYVDGHNAVAKARTNYAKGVGRSVAYQLLTDLGSFGFTGLAARSTFDARIKTVRDRGCRSLTLEAVCDYEQFGRASCPSCHYRLGTDIASLEQLDQDREQLVAAVNNAIDAHLSKLADLLGSQQLQVYTQEKASAEEKTLVASVRSLLKRRHDLSQEQYAALCPLLLPFAKLAGQAEAYAREEAQKRTELRRRLEEQARAKRVPRVATARLADEVRAYLLASGLESMTARELRTHIDAWLDSIAGEFRPRQ